MPLNPRLLDVTLSAEGPIATSQRHIWALVVHWRGIALCISNMPRYYELYDAVFGGECAYIQT